MKIVIAADHRGYAQKQYIQHACVYEKDPIEWYDVGTHDLQRTDYPIFAKKAAALVQNNDVDAGILLCGSGVGMSIVANRYTSVYAGLVWCPTVARMAKEHDNINMLVLPSDFISDQQAIEIIMIWLATQPLSGRYQDRIAMIDDSHV